MNLYGNKLDFQIQFITDFISPGFTGSCFRGAFGRALKNLTCVETQNPSCVNCQQKDCCYKIVFEGTPSKILFKRFRTPPKPFNLIMPPIFEKFEIKSGEKFNFGIVLWGNTCEHKTKVIMALGSMGLNGIGIAHQKGHGKFVIKDIKESKLEFSFNELPELSQIVLELVTPLRIKEKNRILTQFDFKKFIKALLERQSILARYYCSDDNEWDFRHLLSLVSNVKITDISIKQWKGKRFSSRQEQYVDISGLLGKVELREVPSELIPYLWFGQYTNVGEHTTIGLGQYEIKNI